MISADLVYYALVTEVEKEGDEPISYEEAMKSKDKHKWHQAMRDEFNSLTKNETWELVDRPPKQRLVSCKWIFKRKETVDPVEPIRFKARLVARGFTQVEGVDYNEIFFTSGKTYFNTFYTLSNCSF